MRWAKKILFAPSDIYVLSLVKITPTKHRPSGLTMKLVSGLGLYGWKRIYFICPQK